MIELREMTFRFQPSNSQSCSKPAIMIRGGISITPVTGQSLRLIRQMSPTSPSWRRSRVLQVQERPIPPSVDPLGHRHSQRTTLRSCRYGLGEPKGLVQPLASCPTAAHTAHGWFGVGDNLASTDLGCPKQWAAYWHQGLRAGCKHLGSSRRSSRERGHRHRTTWSGL